ncbi:hypothetical protein BB561_005456 [Smittium simulii]|uniref:Uncharacterized protein n=1 Tax=Smittium simulii TaxID=133385 RepID=A0A2T9YAB2_9FUNG|nr:hypothetical protein BB561_005456 [Smittium simulii]
MYALISAAAAQVTITDPTDSRILKEIRDDYNDFFKAANAAIADLMTKNNIAAEAAKKALNGQTTVPEKYNEETVKALLNAVPQILEYTAVWNVIDSNDAGETLDADDLIFSNTATINSLPTARISSSTSLLTVNNNSSTSLPTGSSNSSTSLPTVTSNSSTPLTTESSNSSTSSSTTSKTSSTSKSSSSTSKSSSSKSGSNSIKVSAFFGSSLVGLGVFGALSSLI